MKKANKIIKAMEQDKFVVLDKKLDETTLTLKLIEPITKRQFEKYSSVNEELKETLKSIYSMIKVGNKYEITFLDEKIVSISLRDIKE